MVYRRLSFCQHLLIPVIQFFFCLKTNEKIFFQIISNLVYIIYPVQSVQSRVKLAYTTFKPSMQAHCETSQNEHESDALLGFEPVLETLSLR